MITKKAAKFQFDNWQGIKYFLLNIDKELSSVGLNPSLPYKFKTGYDRDDFAKAKITVLIIQETND